MNKKQKEILDIVTKYPKKVELIKVEDLSDELIIEMVTANYKTYSNLPSIVLEDDNRMESVNYKLVEKTPYIYKEFSYNQRTQEVSEKVLKYNGELLEEFPSNISISEEMIENAVRSNPYTIGLLHDFEDDGDIFYSELSVFKLKELAKVAVKLNPACIQYVFKEYIDLGMKQEYKKYVEKVQKTNPNFKSVM